MIRFVILKEIGDGEGKIVLEYDSDQILSRVQARVKEQLAEKETAIKHKFSKDEIAGAITISWKDLITEFKRKTITLK